MDKKLLIFKEKKDRENIIDILKANKVKIIHDSCERIINIDATKLNEEILGKLPAETQLFVQDEDLKKHLDNLEPAETRFINALNIRNSPEFISNRKKRKPFGKEPEEEEMFTVSCMAEE